MRARAAIAGLLLWSGCHDTSTPMTAPSVRLAAVTKTNTKATPTNPANPGGTWSYNGLPGLEKAQFLPLIETPTSPFAVLQHNPNPALAAGEPRIISLGEPLVVQRELRADLLPREISSWSNTQLTLFNTEIAVCEATIASVVMIGRVSGDAFAEEILAAKDKPEQLASLAKKVWETLEQNPEQLYIAASLSGVGCNGARFARAATLPKPAQAPAVKTSGALQKEALKSFRALAEYKSVQRAYRAQQKLFSNQSAGALWDTLDSTTPNVSVFHAPGLAPLVWVSAASGYYGCDGAIYTLESAFTLSSGEHSLTPVSGGEPGKPLLSPIAAIDVDQDDTLELLTEDGLYRLHNGIYQEWVTLRTPSFAESFCGE